MKERNKLKNVIEEFVILYVDMNHGNCSDLGILYDRAKDIGDRLEDTLGEINIKLKVKNDEELS